MCKSAHLMDTLRHEYFEVNTILSLHQPLEFVQLAKPKASGINTTLQMQLWSMNSITHFIAGWVDLRFHITNMVYEHTRDQRNEVWCHTLPQYLQPS